MHSLAAQTPEEPSQQAEAVPDAAPALAVQPGLVEQSASPLAETPLMDERSLPMALLAAAPKQPAAAELAAQRAAPQPALPLRAEQLDAPVAGLLLLSAA